MAPRCSGCYLCADACNEEAIIRSESERINFSRCTACGRCAQACATQSLILFGRSWTAAELAREVRADKEFFDDSGGGLTLSGGEPTLFVDFTRELLGHLKQAGIHTLLETCGLFDPEIFEQKLYPYLDAIYFDIKLMDDDMHRKYCGASNETILKNCSRLLQLSRTGSVDVLPRTPLIPGVTDTYDNLKAIAGFLTSVGAEKIELLEYHPMWREKNLKLGLPLPTDAPADLDSFSSRGHLEKCRQVFLDEGMAVL